MKEERINIRVPSRLKKLAIRKAEAKYQSLTDFIIGLILDANLTPEQK